ncbi:MAG: DUF4132 domain-containing protein [Myxococcota bacterium]
MGDFGDVRAVLQGGASEETWTKLVDELDQWYGREPLEVVLKYCSDHVSSWPGELPTFAPVGWFKRELAVVRASPITAFFEDALIGRTDYWLEWGRELLDAKKALKTPKFLASTDLGPMRWRTGAPLDDRQCRQLVMLMRQFKEPGVVELERMRQLLHEEDCRRWSERIYAAWTSAGEPSSHRWSLFQVAAFGHERQLDFDARVLSIMVSSGRHARVKQYMDVNAAIGTQTCLNMVGKFAVYADLRLTTRNYAWGLLEPLAAARGLDPERFIERRLDIHDAVVWEAEVWEDPSLGGDEIGRSLADALEHAMLIQRAFPWWRIREHVDLLAKVSGVVWEVEDGRLVHFAPAGALDVLGEIVELHGAQLLRIAHPARMSPEQLGAWSERLDKLRLRAPFVQLKRPTFRSGGDVVWDEREPLELDIDDLDRTPWRFGFEAGDYGFSLIFWIRGAMWYASLDLVSRDGSYDYDSYNSNGILFRALRVLSIQHTHDSREDDVVAFSEAQYALLRLLKHQQLEQKTS